jgi:hypothetical protein
VTEPRPAGGRHENAGPGRLGDLLGHLGRVAAGDVGEHIGRQVRAGDGRDPEHGRARRGQPGEPATDHAADGVRHLRPRAAGGQQVTQLPGEERMPAAAAVHLAGPGVVGRVPGDGPHQQVDLGCGQARQLDQLGTRHQVGQPGGDLGARLVRPVGAHHQQRARTGRLGEEAQQLHGGGIGPLQVVEDHHHRAVGDGAGQQPGDGVEHPQPARCVGYDARWRCVGYDARWRCVGYDGG